MCRFSGDHARSGTGANPMFMRVAEVLQGRPSTNRRWLVSRSNEWVGHKDVDVLAQPVTMVEHQHSSTAQSPERICFAKQSAEARRGFGPRSLGTYGNRATDSLQRFRRWTHRSPGITCGPLPIMSSGCISAAVPK